MPDLTFIIIWLLLFIQQSLHLIMSCKILENGFFLSRNNRTHSIAEFLSGKIPSEITRTVLQWLCQRERGERKRERASGARWPVVELIIEYFLPLQRKRGKTYHEHVNDYRARNLNVSKSLWALFFWSRVSTSYRPYSRPFEKSISERSSEMFFLSSRSPPQERKNPSALRLDRSQRENYSVHSIRSSSCL